MELVDVRIDQATNNPVVILRATADALRLAERPTVLPIFIGNIEAQAIRIGLEKRATPRPMTHDLLRNMISQLNAQVIRVVINDLRDSTFFAQIRIIRDGKTLELDARPSDAIALALRTEAPIFVEQSVLDQAQTISPDSGEEQDEKLKKWFEQLGPDDLGKYKM